MSHRLHQLTLHQINVSHRTDWVVVEITTTDGLVGTGECSDLRPLAAAPPMLSVWAEVLTGHHIGSDLPLLDRQLWDALGEPEDEQDSFRRRLVLGAVLTALCDIEAQVADEPLSRWLGASETPTIDLYANINRAPIERTSREFADVATAAVDAGFNRIKLAPFDGQPRTPADLAEAASNPTESTTFVSGTAHLRAVRDAIGLEPNILVDVHHRLTESELEPAVRVMEELDVGWIEDAVDVRNPVELERLAGMTDIPIAGGEQLTDQAEVGRLCDGGWLDFLLLDPKYIGGPLRFKDMLEVVHDVELTLHDPTGPISTAVSAQLTMLSESAGPLEYAFGEQIDRSAITLPAENLEPPRFIPSGRAGIGTRLDLGSIPNVTSRTWGLFGS